MTLFDYTVMGAGVGIAIFFIILGIFLGISLCALLIDLFKELVD